MTETVRRDAPALTLIVPTFNEEANIASNLEVMCARLEELERPFEILVICDGCTDGTADAASALGDPRVRVISHAENFGKGYAICVGFREARGLLVGWLDADLDVDPGAIVDAVRCFDGRPVDTVIGSKRHPASVVSYPVSRRILSFGYQILVHLLLRVRARDTQVGAKVCRREMIDVVAPLLLIKRYAFDVEVLAVGAEFGFDRIEEVPVRIDYRFTGSEVDARAVAKMFIDTIAIAYRIHLRHWYVRQFAVHQRERGDVARGGGSTAASALERDAAATDVK